MSFRQEEKDLLDLATISVLVPQRANIPLSQAFSNDDEDEESGILLADVKQRETLFFDEQLKIYVVLRLPEGPEESLKSYLSRLKLVVEAWVVEGQYGFTAQTGGLVATKDLVHSHIVSHDEDPIVLVSQSEDEEDERLYLNLIWETTITTHRPRTRMADAYMVIAPSATISPVMEPDIEDDYVMPFQTDEHNLFRSMKGARGFKDRAPYLPASRLRPVPPRPPKQDYSCHLKSLHSQPVKIYPVCVTRMKYPKSSQISPQSSLLASLDVEMLHLSGIKGTIEKSEMSMDGGCVTPLMNHFLPMEWRSRDCVTLLFQLDRAFDKTSIRPVGLPRPANSATVTLVASLDINIHLGEQCTPRISIEWTTHVDFSHTLNSASGTPIQSIQRSNRPAISPFGGINTSNILSANGVFKQEGQESHNLVTISFAASGVPAKVGVPFTWRVFILNKSQRAAKLAIIPLPRIQRSSTQAQKFAKRHAQRGSQISTNYSEKAHNLEREDLNIAPAFIDENIVYAMQHAGAVPPETDLLSLTAELRVGPLGPGQCHEAEIKMVAFRRGALAIDAIRIVDLVKEAEDGAGSPGVIVDCRDLPDVIVE